MAEFTSFINAEAGKPLDLSDVDTPRGESVKAELRRLRAALHEQKVSEALAEKAAWDYVAETDMQLSTVLPGFVLGPALETDYGTSLQLIVEMLKGKYPVVPQIGFEAVDVRDIASLHRLAYENPEAVGKRFIGTNGWVMFKEVADILKEACPDSKVSSLELPVFLSNVLSYIVKDMEMVKGEGGKTKKADNSAAMSLGWQPHSIKDAVASGAESLIKLGIV